MPGINDSELVREFADRKSEAAFAALVRQHVNLVFATALRQVGDRAVAEEITQTVFVALAQSAGKLGSHPTIAGWLHQTTLNKSREWLRSELRRRRREQIAIELAEAHAEGNSVWSPLVPLLDEALLQLRDADRAAVIMHFMEGRTFQEVGSVLGIGEDTARKRVDRCLEQLMKFFQRRGFEIPTLSANAPLFALASHAAPTELTASVTSAGLTAHSTSTLTLTLKGALKIMAWTKAKIAIATVAGLILATSVSVVVIEKVMLVEGKTESQWIKSIKYGIGLDESQLSNQIRLWHSLGPKGIRMLLRALKSPAYDHSTRMCVADLLGRLGNDTKRATPDIINQIKIEKDDGVLQIELGYFEEMLQSMSEKDKAALFPELLRAMQNNDGGVRNNALVALQFYPQQFDTVSQIMVNSLQDSDAYVRLNAARELNTFDSRVATKANIVRVLADCATNLETDNEATVALGELHREPDVAVPALIQCLQSSKSYVRENAAVALGRFGRQAESAVPALTQALSDTDSGVRQQVAATLKRINSNASPK